jgi:hypothetical protein
MTRDIAKKAIAANIQALADTLRAAVDRIAEAELAIRQDEYNQAIGSIIDLDERLETALALYRAALALHRAGR